MLKKLKTKTGMIITLGVVFTLVLGLSYATFIFTTGKYKASELLIGKLNYGISIKEDGQTSTINSNIVTIPKNTKSYFVITIISVNPVDSNYTLAYKANNTLEVKYTDRTSWKSNGFIKGYDDNTYSKKVRVLIDNTSNNTDTTVDFAVYGGYSFNTIASISLGNGYISVTGPVTETNTLPTNRLVDIIEEDTDCITSTSNICLIGGENERNYVQYPEASNKSENIWRITGSYNIDNEVVTKLISTKTSTTTTSSLSTDLTSFYNNLEDKDIYVYNTNKFKCNSSICAESTYTNIGLLTEYEYNQIGGLNSYLSSINPFFIQGTSNVLEATSSGIKTSTSSNLRPVIYINSDVQVTGSGSASDPYILNPSSDINLLSYTLNGNSTTLTYNNLLSKYVVDKVTCKNGSTAEWDNDRKGILFTSVNAPDYCTINFIDGYIVSLKAINGTVEAPTTQGVGSNGSVEFTVVPDEGYLNELESDTCLGTLDGTTYRVSNVTESKNCIITFKKNGTSLATMIKFYATDHTNGVYNENGYRYQGSSPNNYIYMTNDTSKSKELWRIIGIFSDGENGEEVIRVRRHYEQGDYPKMALDANSKNHFPNSTMYSTLSNVYSISNYLHTVNFKMYLGTRSDPNATVATMYHAERGTVAGPSANGVTSFVGSVGIIYPSDYGYGVVTADCSRATLMSAYANTETCYTKNWLYPAQTNWAITPFYSRDWGGFYFTTSLGNGNYGTETEFGYSPMMALNGTVLVSGSGTSSDPYTIVK